MLAIILDAIGVEEVSDKFYRSFATEVRRFLKPIIHEHLDRQK
jgi:hypothetical protein